jgi:hypothetical protein
MNPVNISFDSHLFPAICKVLKNLHEDKSSITISVVNKERTAKLKTEIKEIYKIEIDKLSDIQDGVNIFRLS